jgi:hypothetical protein
MRTRIDGGDVMGTFILTGHESIIKCTLHMFKDQPADGPSIGRKHVVGIIISYNLMKYKVVYVLYIFYIRAASIYRNHCD